VAQQGFGASASFVALAPVVANNVGLVGAAAVALTLALAWRHARRTSRWHAKSRPTVSDLPDHHLRHTGDPEEGSRLMGMTSLVVQQVDVPEWGHGFCVLVADDDQAGGRRLFDLGPGDAVSVSCRYDGPEAVEEHLLLILNISSSFFDRRIPGRFGRIPSFRGMAVGDADRRFMGRLRRVMGSKPVIVQTSDIPVGQAWKDEIVNAIPHAKPGGKAVQISLFSEELLLVKTVVIRAERQLAGRTVSPRSRDAVTA
jgi:hypothetical protein